MVLVRGAHGQEGASDSEEREGEDEKKDANHSDQAGVESSVSKPHGPDRGAALCTSPLRPRVASCESECAPPLRPRRGAREVARSQGKESDSEEREGEDEKTNASEVGKQNYMGERLAEHVLHKHGLTPLQYRREILARSLTEWPQPVSPQVLRSRLAKYKEHLCDANFTMGPCASCARRKRTTKLISVVFPLRSTTTAPAWLTYSAAEWLVYGAIWYDQVSELLDTERYLQIYVEADQRLQEAEQELVDVRHGLAVQGRRNVEEAEVWCRRVQLWRQHLRRDLWNDGAPAPGEPRRRWLLYVPEHSEACLVDSAPPIHCHLCRRCVCAFQRRSKAGGPAVDIPRLCRARGLRGGPEPVDLRSLSYLERRVLQLARVHVTVKCVRGLSWAKSCPQAAPQYTSRNTVAYPQAPDKILRAVCLMPEDLCSVLAVQYVGSDRNIVAKEPALLMNLPRLRSVFGGWAQAAGHGCGPRSLMATFSPTISGDLSRTCCSYIGAPSVMTTKGSRCLGFAQQRPFPQNVLHDSGKGQRMRRRVRAQQRRSKRIQIKRRA